MRLVSPRVLLTLLLLAVMTLLIAQVVGQIEAQSTRTPVTSQTVQVTTDESALQFQPVTLTITAGQPISLTFTNAANMAHNWVLVPITQAATVDTAALPRNGDAQGLPGVLAATPILEEPGSVTITLPALPAGRYRYICTVPGHFAAGMVGDLIVQPAGRVALPTVTPTPRAASGGRVLLPTVTPTPPITPSVTLTTPVAVLLQEVADGFDDPLFVTHAGDGTGQLFVVEKTGRIRTLADGAIFLDIRDRLTASGSEQGLLGLAFHPNFADNGYFYVNYTDTAGDTVIARFTATGDLADPASEQVILTAEQPARNHNGGMLAFGPDRLLYIGLGDGGGSRDRYEQAQNLQTLLGKILRIAVDTATTGMPYAVPANNPFVDDAEIRPEIWAYGLRNPWRFSFDRATGDLYIADVGQNRHEWLHYQPADSPGGQNYGWPILEGQVCLDGTTCDRRGLTEAIHSYPHRDGNCSVTGGYVYRGTHIPALQGHYLFGDYCSGQIWTLTRQGDEWVAAELIEGDLALSSFGEDEAGEIYITDLSGGGIYQLVPAE